MLTLQNDPFLLYTSNRKPPVKQIQPGKGFAEYWNDSLKAPGLQSTVQVQQTTDCERSLKKK